MKIKYHIMKLTFTVLSIFLISFSTALNAQSNSKNEIRPVKTTEVNKKSPRITTSTRPINNASTVRGNDVIGEGQYLSFTKKIMSMSKTGGIPIGFPRHVKGQNKGQYVEVMKLWVKNNPEKMVHLQGEGEYLDFDEKIKQMSITNSIPVGFPKHKVFQSLGEYKVIMKNWAKQNPDKVKEEYKK